MKILSLENLNGWSPVNISSIPFEVSEFCPACNEFLRTIAYVRSSIRDVRIGCCDTCGYMGYIDRPTAQWFSEFYSTRWDQKGQQKDSGITRENFTKFRPNIISTLLRLIKGPGRFLDIGSGFGYNLLDAEKLGREAVGVEGSEHRAEACEKLGFKVYRGKFEELEIKERFEVISHHHVLEHVRDPNLFIKKCSDIQQPGDFMLASMPNNMGEPTMGVFMYLPHIHSFTVASVQKLFGRFGYEIRDFSATTKASLNIIAVKKEKPVGTIKIRGFSKEAINKVMNGLDMQRRWFNPKRRLIWSLANDDAKQLPLRKKAKGFIEPRSLIMRQGKPELPLMIESEVLFVK